MDRIRQADLGADARRPDSAVRRRVAVRAGRHPRVVPDLRLGHDRHRVGSAGRPRRIEDRRVERRHRGDRSEVVAGRRPVRAGVGVRVPAEPRPGVVGPPEERVDAGQALVQRSQGVAVCLLDLGLVEARCPDRVLAPAWMVDARAAPMRRRSNNRAGNSAGSRPRNAPPSPSSRRIASFCWARATCGSTAAGSISGRTASGTGEVEDVREVRRVFQVRVVGIGPQVPVLRGELADDEPDVPAVRDARRGSLRHPRELRRGPASRSSRAAAGARRRVGRPQASGRRHSLAGVVDSIAVRAALSMNGSSSTRSRSWRYVACWPASGQSDAQIVRSGPNASRHAFGPRPRIAKRIAVAAHGIHPGELDVERRNPREVANAREVGEVPGVRRKAEVVQDLDRIGSLRGDPVDAGRERQRRRPLDHETEVGCRRRERDECGELVRSFDRQRARRDPDPDRARRRVRSELGAASGERGFMPTTASRRLGAVPAAPRT